MPKKRKRAGGGAIRYGMGVFGDQWTLLIIRNLWFKGKKHYGEFSDPGEGIATNTLSDRLARLVSDGIIKKDRDPSHGARFIYRLSEEVKDLLPVTLAIIEWSAKYDANTEAPPAFLEKLRRGPAALKNEILRALA